MGLFQRCTKHTQRASKFCDLARDDALELISARGATATRSYLVVQEIDQLSSESFLYSYLIAFLKSIQKLTGHLRFVRTIETINANKMRVAE
jgi:hypothetical protein